MAAIDIGSGAEDYPTYGGGGSYTYIDRNNPANASGTLTTFEIWQYGTGYNVKMGTFYGSGTSQTNRDYESLGTVAAGSKQTYTGLNCSCQTNDYIGWYSSSGDIEMYETDQVGTQPFLFKAGDQFGTGTQTYAYSSLNYKFALYGTGETDGQPTRKRHAGNPFTPFRKGVW